MGFLDNLRDRILGNPDDDYYDDDYDDYDEEEEEPQSSGILGNTRRPEADSVSVYTRSGRPLNETPVATYEPERRSYDYDRYADPDEPMSPRVSSGQLPPYVLRPVAYDDVQAVVRRVRTNQPVVLVFKQTDLEVAKRILDFCFGLSFGIGGAVQPVAGKAFIVLPADITLPQSEIDRLISQAR
jgi:cell division inhibitor SepF